MSSLRAAHKVVLCVFPRFRFISRSRRVSDGDFSRHKKKTSRSRFEYYTWGISNFLYCCGAATGEALAAGAHALIHATFIGFSHLFARTHRFMMAWQTAWWCGLVYLWRDSSEWRRDATTLTSWTEFVNGFCAEFIIWVSRAQLMRMRSERLGVILIASNYILSTHRGHLKLNL